MTYKELYDKALFDLEHDNITLGEFERITEPLNKEIPEDKIAEWIFKTPNAAKCSNCGYVQCTNGKDLTGNVLIHKAIYHYCPKCGCKMKG